MLPIMAVAIALQIQIAETDVQMIMESVVEYLASDSTTERLLEGRQISIANESKGAFNDSNIALESLPESRDYAIISKDDTIPKDVARIIVERVRLRDGESLTLDLTVSWNDGAEIKEEPIWLKANKVNETWIVTSNIIIVP